MHLARKRGRKSGSKNLMEFCDCFSILNCAGLYNIPFWEFYSPHWEFYSILRILFSTLRILFHWANGKTHTLQQWCRYACILPEAKKKKKSMKTTSFMSLSSFLSSFLPPSSLPSFLSLSFFPFVLFFFLFMAAPFFLDPGVDPSCSCNICLSCGNTRSLTHCAGPGIKPTPPQRPSLCSQVLNPLCHSRNFLWAVSWCNSFPYQMLGVFWLCLLL